MKCDICGWGPPLTDLRHHPGCPYPKTMAGQFEQLREEVDELLRVITNELRKLPVWNWISKRLRLQ